MNIFKKRVKTSQMVIVLLALIALGLAGWFYWPSKKGAALDSEAKAVLPVLNETKQDVISRECLINDYGIPVKVLTKRHGVHCVTEPGGTQQIGADLGLFHPYFCFGQYPDPPEDKKPIHYRIGTSMMLRDVIGWVSSDNVQRWDTRVGAEYGIFLEAPDPSAAKSSLPRLYVFGSEADLISYLNGNKVEPIARAEFDEKTAKALMPWPITAVKTVEIKGQAFEILEIAFLGEYREGTVIEDVPAVAPPKPAFSPEEKKAYQEKTIAETRKVDIVFCIDATGSMQPYIDQVKTAVKQFVNTIKSSEYQPELSFGLVEYRDYEEGYPDKSVAKIYNFESNADTFCKMVDSIEANAGGDEREAVLDALMSALSFEWKADLSQHIVILIGDNSGHDDTNNSQNPRELTVSKVLDEANKDKIHARIFTLKAPCRSGDVETKRHAKQFEQLATDTQGQYFTLDNAAAVVPAVNAILKKGSEDSQIAKEVTTWVTEGKIKPPSEDTPEAISRISNDREICQVLTIMSKSKIEWEKLAPGQITFSTGWVCIDSAGSRILNKKVYISKPELRTLRSTLDLLVQGLNDPAALAVLVDTAKASRIGISSFFTDTNSIMKMDETMLDEGLPIGEHSLLKFSRRELFMKPEDWRRDIAKQIEDQYLPKLANSLRDNSAFPDPDELSYGWIWEAYLP